MEKKIQTIEKRPPFSSGFKDAFDAEVRNLKLLYNVVKNYNRIRIGYIKAHRFSRERITSIITKMIKVLKKELVGIEIREQKRSREEMIHILEEFNKWRLGDKTIPDPDPVVITETTLDFMFLLLIYFRKKDEDE